MRYEWKNTETGEVVESEHWSIPPDKSGNWQRVFRFGVGRVEGGGGSPGRATKNG